MDERTCKPDGEKVKKERQRPDRLWTQEHLAEAAGVSVAIVRRIESGQRVFPDNLKAVAAALDVDFQTLLDDSEPAQPSHHPKPQAFDVDSQASLDDSNRSLPPNPARKFGIIILSIVAVALLVWYFLPLNFPKDNPKHFGGAVASRENDKAGPSGLTPTIDAPREGEVISTGVYDNMHGTYVGELGSGYRLWVFARDRYNYFLMYPPTQITPSMKRWSQTNVRLGSSGRWELHVCLANEAASRWLEARARNNDWSGFPSLPEGVKTVRHVTVERQ